MAHSADSKKLDKQSTRQQFLRRFEKKPAPSEPGGAFSAQLMHGRALKKLIPFPKRALDLGSGPGAFTIFLGNQGCEAHGIDIDLDLIKIARQRAREVNVNPYFVVANAEKLPYRDESFDLCVANSLLEHVNDFEAVLDEVARVLKVNGLLALCTTNRWHPFQKEVKLTSSIYFPFYPWLPSRFKDLFIKYCMQKRPDLVNYTDLPAIHWFSYGQLKSLLTDKGFRVYEYLHMLSQSDMRGLKKLLLPLFQGSRILNLIYHFYCSTVTLYAIKTRKIRSS